MNLVLWSSSVPGTPKTLLVTFQEKSVPQDGVKGRARSAGHSLGPLPSPPPRSPLCPQPEVPGFNSHMGSLTSQQSRPQPWPQVHGHRHDCSEEVTARGSQDQSAHQRGHTTDTPYPVAHVSDKLKRQHIS